MLNAVTGRSASMMVDDVAGVTSVSQGDRSEEHTSELQSQSNLVCRLLLEKKKKQIFTIPQSRSRIASRSIWEFFYPTPYHSFTTILDPHALALSTPSRQTS